MEIMYGDRGDKKCKQIDEKIESRRESDGEKNYDFYDVKTGGRNTAAKLEMLIKNEYRDKKITKQELDMKGNAKQNFLLLNNHVRIVKRRIEQQNMEIYLLQGEDKRKSRLLNGRSFSFKRS